MNGSLSGNIYDNSFSQLSKEQEMVLLLTDFRSANTGRIKELTESPLDWAEIGGHLLYNRVAGIAKEVIKKCLRHEKLIINHEFLFNLDLITEIQKIRTKIHTKSLCSISEKLVESGLPHAFLKGSILANSIYPLGCRISKDIDILLNSRDLTKCGGALKELGFIQGSFDSSKNEIIPATRKEIMLHRMNYGEVVPYLKKVDEPGLTHIEIDINFSMDWTAQGSEDVVAAFLEQTENYKLDNGQYVRSLACEYFLAHLCVHLYKEAYVLNWVEWQRDLSLYKFVDIYLFITNPDKRIDWSKFIRIVKIYNIEKECYYALAYTKTFFPNLGDYNDFIKSFKEIKPENVEYLNEVVDATDSNIRYIWNTDLLSRFFDMKRYNSLKRIYCSGA